MQVLPSNVFGLFQIYSCYTSYKDRVQKFQLNPSAVNLCMTCAAANQCIHDDKGQHS